MTQVASHVHHSVMVQKIKKRMDEMGINARQLAARAQVGKSFVYDILNGKSKNPTSSKLNSISKELGISVSYLINNAGNSINYDHYVPIYSLEDQRDANVLLSKSFCLERLCYGKSDLYAHRMHDDSMMPTIQNNEFVIVKAFKPTDDIQSGIYLIRDKFGSIIRRIERIIGTDGVKIAPDNSKYSTYTKNLEEITVVGKVVLGLKEM